MTNETNTEAQTPAGERSSFLPTVLTVLALVAAAGASVAYYRYPPFAARALASFTGKAGFLPANVVTEARVERSSWPQSAKVLAPAVQAPLTETDKILRIDEMRRRPSLLIEGATLVFDPDHPARIATSKLTLRNSTLVTGGADIDIEVETLVVDNSEIRAITLSDTAPARGAGRDAGKVRLTVHGRLTGVLRVDLGAQAGAAGAPGRPGQAGGDGAKGEDARAAGETCQRQAGPGAAGGPGGKGGDGGDGAPGGNGGQFTLISKDPTEAAQHIDFGAEGGRAGAAGAAGPGGEGGPGGLGGAPIGVCIGAGASGPRGPNGPAGKPGAAGAAGQAGAMRTLTLGEKP